MYRRLLSLPFLIPTNDCRLLIVDQRFMMDYKLLICNPSQINNLRSEVCNHLLSNSQSPLRSPTSHTFSTHHSPLKTHHFTAITLTPYCAITKNFNGIKKKDKACLVPTRFTSYVLRLTFYVSLLCMRDQGLLPFSFILKCFDQRICVFKRNGNK